MVNLPRPPADSIIKLTPKDNGVILAYNEKRLQHPLAWIVLMAVVAVWLVGFFIPLANVLSTNGSFTAPALIWLVVWGGVGSFFINNFIRQRVRGRVQRIRFETDRLEFLPKARLPRSGPHPSTHNRNPRQPPIPHRTMARGPLRVSELDRQDLDGVGPDPRGGVALKTRSGDIHIARTLTPADTEYLLHSLETWRNA